MFGFVKKEEISSMTEPLISSAHEVELPDNDELVREFISSIADTSTGYNSPEYVQNGYYGHQNGGLYRNANGGFMNGNEGYVDASSYIATNGCIDPNSTMPVYSNGHAVGIDNINFLGEEIDTSENRGFEIEYIQFPDQVIKVQRRKGRESCQRLRTEDSKIKLGIKMLGVGQVIAIKVFVSRVQDPSFQLTDILTCAVELEAQTAQKSVGEYRVGVNLDSIYEVGGKKVYALAKNKTEEVNLFFLKIVVIFIDGSTSEANTKCFKVIGKAKDSGKKDDVAGDENVIFAEPSYLPPPAVAGNKRQRTGTDESNSSSGSNHTTSGYNSKNCSSPSGYSSVSSPEAEGLVKASRIAADYLEAKNAEIGSLIVAEPVKTARGDIAYHFILKNPDDHPQFQEGEIVGLFVNEKGVRLLDKLTQKNSVDAVLKGVISRSQYLEAQVQPKGVRTETICMFGIVPVKVRGSVRRGDILYASPTHPGVAVSSMNLGVTPLLSNDASAIGMAWETIFAHDDELNNVQCLVSVTMEVFQGMIEKRVKSLKKDVKLDIENIKKARKKSRRRRYICIGSLTAFLALLSILLWQVFMPMSAFRRWMCARGHIEGHWASFIYIPTSDIYEEHFAKGMEFKFATLLKKLGESFKPINGTGYRYFYNIDVCANGGKSDKDPVLKKKSVGGPSMFALDETCQSAYYYSGAWKRWCKYRSARNIKCSPPGTMPRERPGNSTGIGPGFCT